MTDYPIQTLAGSTYDGPPGLEALLSESAPAYGTEKDIVLYDGSIGRFVYCYSALTTILVGGAVQLGYTGSVLTTVGANPRVTVPDTTGAVPHIAGIATKSVTAAGGLWVQTKGRCWCARVDGATDVALGTHLTPVNAAQYLTTDHATVATVAGFAIFEACRHGAAGATAWTITSETASPRFETLAAYPIYYVPETLAIAAQGNTTNGDPAAQIYLTGIVPTI